MTLLGKNFIESQSKNRLMNLFLAHIKEIAENPDLIFTHKNMNSRTWKLTRSSAKILSDKSNEITKNTSIALIEVGGEGESIRAFLSELEFTPEASALLNKISYDENSVSDHINDNEIIEDFVLPNNNTDSPHFLDREEVSEPSAYRIHDESSLIERIIGSSPNQTSSRNNPIVEQDRNFTLCKNMLDEVINDLRYEISHAQNKETDEQYNFGFDIVPDDISAVEKDINSNFLTIAKKNPNVTLNDQLEEDITKTLITLFLKRLIVRRRRKEYFKNKGLKKS